MCERVFGAIRKSLCRRGNNDRIGDKSNNFWSNFWSERGESRPDTRFVILIPIDEKQAVGVPQQVLREPVS